MRPLSGDIITSIGGEATRNPVDLVREIGKHDPEAELSIEYVRKGDVQVATARLIERPEDIESFLRKVSGEVESLGLMIKALDSESAVELGLGSGSGVLVEAVEGDSPADRAGLRPGDVIRRVDGVHLETTEAFSRSIRKAARSGETIRILVERANLTYFLILDPETG